MTESPLPPWGLAVAGATGAVLANALVYPLDIVKTRLQVQEKPAPSAKPLVLSPGEHRHYRDTLHALQCIVKDEGPAGLYSGMVGSLIGTASSNFAYFYWYSIVRTLYFSRQKTRGNPSTAAELSLGAVAGALAQVFTIPIAVVTTRQQTQPKGERRSILQTARDVVESEDGWTGLWRGMKASLVLVINPSITYGAYQRLSQILFHGRKSLRAHEAFLLGALSKALATIVTQPLIVAKVGLQSRPPPSRAGKPFKSFIEVMRFITKNEGPRGLFKGISPQILKGLLVQGFLMMTKERVELLFLLLYVYWKQMRARQLQHGIGAAVVAKAGGLLPLVTKA